ncbi:Cupredoxin [Aspergillus bertholletiae]|uniref:Cupredoxin n=1 Tax=Aspergillus bertholletiae TaxID=1226010 RepID=A0A5N7BIC5_9EURO|nr:Cupredoxin [Aspergillus bertholletiae]
MQILPFAIFFQFLALGHAQNGRQDSTATSSAAGAVHTVDVGEDGFVFDPDTLTVSPGGKVEFHFYPGNHSVAQASFSNPCHPLSASSIFSGFMTGSNGRPQQIFTLTVNDTNPIWYYCGQIGHCQAGMVGVINPPGNGSDTLAAFKSAASNASGSTVPDTIHGGIAGESSNSTTASSFSQASTSTTSSGTKTTTSSSTPASMSRASMSTASGSTPSPTSKGSTLSLWPVSSVILITVVSLALAIM